MYYQPEIKFSTILFILSCFYLYTHTRILTPYLFSLCVFFHTFIFYLYDNYFKNLKNQFEKERQYILEESIHTSIYTQDEELCCDICYDEIQKGQNYSELVCDCREKYYHYSCIQKWFLRKNVCPFCRQEFKFL